MRARIETIRPTPLDLVLWALAALGAFAAYEVMVVYSTDALHGGAQGWDAYAYWSAASRLIAGRSPYIVELHPGLGGFYNPPIFAQAAVPLATLGWPIFSIVLRAVEFCSLRVLAGSWRSTLIWCLFPPVLIELNVGNVVLLTAAGASLALRGRGRLLGLTSLPKAAPLILAPVVWVIDRTRRRELVLGIIAAAALVGLSMLTGPSLWADWSTTLAALKTNGDAKLQTGFDSVFFIRFGIAAGMIALALWKPLGRPRTIAYMAVLIALPALRLTSLAMLAGLPLLAATDYKIRTRQTD